MILHGNLLDYLIVFGAGVLLSFSPCIYPLIPVTLGYIGARSNSKVKGFFLSLIYVSGMSITYAILGIIASLTGRIFGKISGHPLSYFIVANACILAGLSLLDIIILPLPKLSIRYEEKKSYFLSVFIMGLISGLAVGPCTAPVLGTLLVYVATKQNILFGTSLVFTFAFGMGLLLILVGTFSGFMANLPKSGSWLLKIKKAYAFVLIAIGEYFLILTGKYWI